MPDDLKGLEQVAIALDGIEIADSVRLTGIDLDNGQRTSVLVERQSIEPMPARAHLQLATGLVLTLSIERIVVEG